MTALNLQLFSGISGQFGAQWGIMEHLMSEKEAGGFLGWRPATMRLNRRRGRGPAFYRVGKKILYRKEDLEKFLQSRRVEQPLADR